MPAVLRALKPRHTTMNAARIQGKATAFLRSLAADFTRAIATYPPQEPTTYVRTGTLGRNWGTKTTYTPNSVTIENQTPYGIYVQGDPNGRPHRRQTAVMRAKGWPNVKTEGRKALKKNRDKLRGLR